MTLSMTREDAASAGTGRGALLARVRELVVDRYFTVDLRTLALFRVSFGMLLLCNLYDRVHGLNGVTFFTDDGLAPASAMVQWHHSYNWSLMFAVTTQNQLWVAVALIAGVYAAFIIGWHTKVMQALVALSVVSLNQRNILLENGGVWLLNILAVFGAFLPLGARFSLDALRLPSRPRGAVARVAYGALVFELAVIYALTGLHKNGRAWHDGTAVHLTLWHARVVNNAGIWMRSHQPSWFSPLITRATIFAEVTLAFLILSPWRQREARRVALVLIFALHTGIALVTVLGPFSFGMMTLGLLLVGPEDWAALDRLAPRWSRTLVQEASARLYRVFGPRLPELELAPPARALRSALALSREGAAALLLVSAVLIILHVNPIMPKLTRDHAAPGFAVAIIDSLRMEQRWTMFAPDAPHSDSMLVVDGELADGRHIDPLTGRAPDFEPILHANDLNEQWRDYVYRIGQDKYARFRPYLRDYLMRIHTLPGAKIHKPLKRVDVYWVTHKSPLRPGLPVGSITRTLLISSDGAAGPGVAQADPSHERPPGAT